MDDADHVAKTRAINKEGLAFYEAAFRERGLEFVPSVANFILVKVGEGDKLFRDMLKQGVIIRAMSGYKLPDWVRISIGTPEQNRRCLEVMDAVMSAATV